MFLITEANRQLNKIVPNILSQTKTGTKEIYHFTDEGTATWYDLAYYTISRAGLPCEVIPIHTAEYPTPAKRPAFSVLDKTKFKTTFNKSLPHWTEGVDKCLMKLS